MLKLKCRMFEESKKSTASENIIITIIIFLVMFVVIQLAESLIPSIMSNSELKQRIIAEGTTDIKRSMEISVDVMMQPKYLIPTLFCTVFGTLISIIYCRFIEARHLSSMGMRKKKAGIHYLQGLLVGFVMISAAALLSALFGITEISVSSSVNWRIIGLMLVGFLIQGMSEEFIFRGYLMNTLGGRHNPWLAVIISSTAFSLAHLLNPGFNLLVFFNLTLFGAFAGLYMIAFDDIWGVSAIHSIWNFTQGSFYGISVSGTGETDSLLRTTAVSDSVLLSGGDFGIEGSLVTTFVLITACVPVLMKIKKQDTSVNK